MKDTFQQPLIWLLVCIFHQFFVPASGAQSCSFSAGKSFHELQSALQAPKQGAFSFPRAEDPKLNLAAMFQISEAVNAPLSHIFLPRWSAEDLPFFCKIEHDWSKNRARFPVKFRLGSVEYVDWLEGKGWDETRY